MVEIENSSALVALAFMTVAWVFMGVFALADIDPYPRLFLLYSFAGFIPWAILAWLAFLSATVEALKEVA